MSLELTPDRLQEIAVKCVTQFMQKSASLNEAIAKEAMDLELNPEQTKRVIEASNTIAYLRQLEKSADRTFEFDVADYSKVMATMCLPDDMSKQAGHEADEKVTEGLNKVEKEIQDVKKEQARDEKEDAEMMGDRKESEKDDEDKDDKKKSKSDKESDKDKGPVSKSDESNQDKDSDEKDEDSEEKIQEKKAMLMKGYFHVKGELEKMAYDEATLVMELVSAAEHVSRDVQALEKIAFVAEGQVFEKLVKLCGIEKRAQEDLIFTDKDLAGVRNLLEKFSSATIFQIERAHKEDFVKRAEQVLFKTPVDIEKQAFLANLAGGLARGVGSAIAGVAGSVGRSAGNAIKGIGQFSGAAKARGFKSTDQAVAAFDKIKSTQGTAAAKAKFGGAKPSTLVHRIGFGGAMTAAGTALTGLSVDHKNNVRDI